VQAVCPVCRERLPEEIITGLDGDDLRDSLDADDDRVKYEPSAEMIEMQQKMSELYQQQLHKGGIIDVQAERNKYLVPNVSIIRRWHYCIKESWKGKFFHNIEIKH